MFLLFIVVLLIANGFWFYYRFGLYGPFVDITKDTRFPGEHISRKDDTTYSISDFHYLVFKGNLAISSDPGSDLIVWLHIVKPDEYGFSFYDEEGNTYQLIVDQEGTLLNAERYTKEIIDQFEMNRAHLQVLLKKYHLWEKAAQENNCNFYDVATRSKQ